MITTYAELERWRANAAARHGDPGLPVAHLGFRWHAGPLMEYAGPEMVCSVWGGQFTLLLRHRMPLSMPLVAGPAQVRDGTAMAMAAWGSKRIAPSVWAIEPSLAQPGFIHAYIVIVDVPSDPPPLPPPPSSLPPRPPRRSPQMANQIIPGSVKVLNATPDNWRVERKLLIRPDYDVAVSCHHANAGRTVACGGCYARMREALDAVHDAETIEQARAIIDAVWAAMKSEAKRRPAQADAGKGGG